jgi:hypothetical protein
MSTPTGHPDFLAYATWRGPPVVSQAYSVAMGSPLSWSQYVTQFAALQLSLTVGSNEGVTLNLGWYTDSTFATIIENNSWQVYNSGLQCIVPILGPYVDVQLSNGLATTATGELYVAPLNVPTPAARYQSGFNVVQSNAEAVTASTTVSFQLSQVVEGTAWLTLNPADATGKLNATVTELTANGGNGGTLLAVDGFTQPVTLSCGCGRNVLQLNVTNTDATGPHSLGYYLRTITQ